MSKLFKSIVAASVGVAMAIGVGVGLGSKANAVYADEQTVTWTATSGALGSGIGSGTISTGSFSWNYTRTLVSGSSYTGWSSECIQLGKNGGVENLVLTTSAIPGTIKSVSVECSSYQGKHNVSISVGGTTYLASTATASWTTVSAKTGTGSSSGGISINFTDGTRALYIKSISVTYDSSGGGDPDPVTYTGVEVSEKSALTGTYKGEAYYECQAEVSGTGAYNTVVTWSITSTNTYGSGTSITNVASIDTNGKITFFDNVNAIYVWATAADESTHNTTGFSVAASGLLENPINSWTKITDIDDVSVNKVYALSNDKTYFAGQAVSSNNIALTTLLSSIGYVALESAASGYYVRFATYSNDAWAASGNYIKWANDSTKLSSTASPDSSHGVWNIVANDDNGVYLKNVGSNRHLGLNGTSDIRAYASSNMSSNAPVYLWEVGSLPVIDCDSIELTGKPTASMSIGDTATLGYFALGTDGNEWNGDVVYSISNESSNGVVELSATSGTSVTLTAKKAGTARVSVQDKDKKADADYVDVTVLADPERIELPTGSYSVVIDASKEGSSTLPPSREYEIKAKDGRTWYQNLSVSFSNITVDTSYGEYVSAKSNGALTVTNNSNAKISNVKIHYYKYENEGVGIYVNDSILTPTSSTGTSGTDNDLYRGYTNITGNTFALCNKNSDYTSKFFTVTITLTVANENEEFFSLVISKGTTATSFTEGDAPNATGLTVYENYTTDGSTISRSEDVTASVTWNYSIEAIAAKTTSYTVTATYGGHTSATVTIDGFTVIPVAKYSLFTSKIVEGDYIIYYNGAAMNNTILDDRVQYDEAVPVNNKISTNDTAVVWHIAPIDENYYTIYNANADVYLASTGAKNKAQLLDNGTSDKALWTISGSNGEYEFVNKQNTANGVNANLRKNGTYGFACYGTSTGGALSLYKKVESYISTATSIASIRGEATVVSGQVTAVTSITLRFGVKIPKADWDEISGITEFGIKMFLCSKAKLATAPLVKNAESVSTISKTASKPDEDGQGNYNFFVTIEVPDTLPTAKGFGYNTYVCARPYVVVDGVTHYLLEQDIRESIVSLANAGNNTNLSQDALTWLKNKEE